MLFRSKRAIWFFAALLIVAAIGTVVGIVTHEEPTMASERYWPRVPLSVSCMNHDGSDRECDVAEEAVRSINLQLGFEMLSWKPNVQMAMVSITMDAPLEVGSEDPGGHYELEHVGRAAFYRCRASTTNVAGADDLELLAIMHELGHCMGLAHDAFRGSIMYPEQSPTPDGTTGPRIPDADRAALRERYAP